MSGKRVSERTRALVRQRAEGRCEYCRLPEWAAFDEHQLDHIVPRRHGGRNGADNLALACACCNRCKGTDMSAFDPLDGTLVRLFHPRRQAWTGHFRFVGLRIKPLSVNGRATARHLRFNVVERIEERRRVAELEGVS